MIIGINVKQRKPMTNGLIKAYPVRLLRKLRPVSFFFLKASGFEGRGFVDAKGLQLLFM
jgi:hypothetical protein